MLIVVVRDRRRQVLRQLGGVNLPSFPFPVVGKDSSFVLYGQQQRNERVFHLLLVVQLVSEKHFLWEQQALLSALTDARAHQQDSRCRPESAAPFRRRVSPISSRRALEDLKNGDEELLSTEANSENDWVFVSVRTTIVARDDHAGQKRKRI